MSSLVCPHIRELELRCAVICLVFNLNTCTGKENRQVRVHRDYLCKLPARDPSFIFCHYFVYLYTWMSAGVSTPLFFISLFPTLLTFSPLLVDEGEVFLGGSAPPLHHIFCVCQQTKIKVAQTGFILL